MKHIITGDPLVKRVLLIFFLFCMQVHVYSQFVLRFYNESMDKAVYLEQGDHAKFEYMGYLDQIEVAEGYILELNDSLLVLGEPFLGRVNGRKTIAIHDIVGFRKFTLFRDISKNVVQVGMIFGSYFLLKEIYRNNSFTLLEDLGISLGVGLSLSFLIKLIYPDKIKYRLHDGWSMILIHPRGT
jgi:hypothetical protein